ncbi:hypothetical protein BA059_26680 [Mycolicibacterium sp. (ex Dasyatis americana)]|uniref:Transmembrane protein n=1 Tax=Mycobacterium syngnathidarum TaxID=1908205 RepID=A0A1Q9W9K3_9MYCO|nr:MULTISPECIES: hypothetical protein [Mycobacterium]OFB35979.1 hypothetical protein BA059_26680 [Mycolicibacterium sp. (ex Dasyatis americana)]MCG7607634.1 hypothetical protein [Mycobacterium sp. CnD-18-1]OHU01117.1 hypothetical protein BKG61_11080 [Mycobacterium syngnathidarum]OLT95497.1 hypothetical protein BKG60_16870 [Mycobacterium syngnathidarum]TMS52696.1 hypothetical protein E0T84_14510 [Mycobacterium sp. DBP42]
MVRLRPGWRVAPGWLVALCAAVLVVVAWLPWLTTSANGGGRANAIGGAVGSIVLPHGFGAGQLIVLLGAGLIVAGAMAGRGLSQRWASAAGLTISLALVALTVWYYTLNVQGPVAAGYGLYLGGAMAVLAALCSVWSLVSTLGQR